MKKIIIAILLSPLITFGADNFNVLDNTSATISGGTINNTVIGGTTPAAGTFSSLKDTGLSTGLVLGAAASNFSTYAGTSCTNQFQRSLSASGAATCETVSLTADVAGITPTANGGTGIAFFTAAGPTVARVYTFPDAAATILYSGGALGTPSSGVATNLTGTASGLTAGNVTTNANLTGPITSSGNATAVAAQTGTGSTFVMQASPTITGTLTASGLSTTGATPTFGYNVTGGPVMHIQDTSATGIKAVIGTIAFDANNSGPAQQTQAQVSAGMNDNAGGSNDGSIALDVVSNNVMANVFTGNSSAGSVLSANIPVNLRVGSASAPTVALDVTGAISATGAISGANIQTGTSSLTLTTGALAMSKMTASASAPGAGGAKLELVCGTNAGTAKLVISAGTSATTVTIVDNIGAGVTGC